MPYSLARDRSHAHCVCVVGKTTVCRIFSCRRSLRGKYRPAESFGDRGALFPGPPSLAHSWGPNAPLRSLASITRAPPRTPARSLAGPLRPAPPPRSSLTCVRSLRRNTHARCPAKKPCKDRPNQRGEPGLRAPGEPHRPGPTPTKRSGPERGSQGPAKGASACGRRQLNKVENTGLEPVTSWLQTRRSPS